MQYNYDFEIASLLIMTIIFLHFAFIRQFPIDKTKVFGMFLSACIAECVFNILSSIGLANTHLVPQNVNEILVFAFFIMEGLSSYLLFRYFMIICELRGLERRVVGILGTIPFWIFSVAVIVTPFIGFFYYFKDGVYYQGFGASFGYLYIVYYLVLNLLLGFRKFHSINTRTKVIIFAYTVVAVSMVLLQFQMRGVLLTSVANAMVVLMLYLAMQNPNEMVDVVTDVGNEKAFMELMQHHFNHTAKVVVISVQLKKFQNIRNIFGVGNANIFLCAVAQYLQRLTGKHPVFHISSDLFAIILDSEERAEEFKTQIGERFKQDWEIHGNRVVLDAVVVTLCYPDEFYTFTEYMRVCQFMLEDAAGTDGGVYEADSGAIERYHRRLKVELAVAKAIHNKAFDVYYQPIYSTREKKIVSLEALVRLNDDELGFISPDEFIPMAERDGSIVQIGAQVLEECCKFLAHHVLSSVSLGIETIQVNVSMVQCMRLNLSETILPILEKYHIPTSMITLEFTENTAISTPERVLKHMQELGAKGITFAMDDYGSGNSNCSYLIRFPFQEVKIDKEIVWASFENETAKTVLENEINTMKKLGLPIVVEGIETKEQSARMEALGVDYIQGYYYGKPLSEAECLRYIRKQNNSWADA